MIFRTEVGRRPSFTFPAAFRAALRISRRDALRARGRSALIVAMVGLPVLVITLALILVETADVTPDEELTSRIGAADLRIRASDVLRPGRPPGDPAALLGPGARIIPFNTGGADLWGTGGYDRVAVRELDLRDPLTRGTYRLLRGRLPAAPGEIAVTPRVAERGSPPGTAPVVTRRRRPVRVVGVVEHPHRPDSREIVGLPSALLPGGTGTGWLADTPEPMTMADVRRLREAGLTVHAPVIPGGSEYLDECCFVSGINDPEEVAGIALIVVMGVLEVTLLAGPAFAVGARRRRRELALVAAQGGSPGQVRMVLLADGVVLGGGAALLGLALGVGLGALSAALEAGRLIGRVGPLDIPWVPVLVVTALGAVAGMTAAVLPAVRAARQDVAAVLAGRRSGARGRAGHPLPGLVLLLAGAAATVLAIRFRTTWVLIAAVPAQLGLIALAPSLVRGAAVAAGALPLPLRLAVRDAARNRGRTAWAVAAVMTATAACTVAAVMTASGFAVRSAAYHAALPEGTTTITGLSLDDTRWARAREVAGRRTPGTPPVEAVAPMDVRGAHVEIVTEVSSGGAPYGRHYHGGLPVGDGRLLTLVQGREDPVAAAAFAAGRAVVFDPDLVRDGRLRLRLTVRRPGGRPRGIPADPAVPAVVARAADPRHAVAVLPASALPALGLKPAARVLYLDPAAHRLGPAERTRLERELAATAGRAEVTIQSGLGRGVLPQLALLLAAAAVLALGGTLAATGLAAADLRPDLATMAAVGAKPGTRRLVVAGQAGFITALGALAGAPQGVAIGVAALWPVLAPGRTISMPPHRGWLPPFPAEPPVVAVPWVFLTALVVGLPLLAALVAGTFTRVRVTLTRRVT
ncbi:ABC transporter permease [Streptosporangium pseudovulgare]|uniref:ABC3 transporter permease C-terminal domain-containing protein n=1 Tax=Streptosporangium pseudovulgare TaxID=35765 RepID=A0ABQ2QXD7_9ACTN|nr:ABC transporter permease [Streptosporangium pseudovulgare]GGQ02887.1 hypothetical protein GCM10010140_36420 [Streptosporangium pseudovulgare]